MCNLNSKCHHLQNKISCPPLAEMFEFCLRIIVYRYTHLKTIFQIFSDGH